MNRDKYVEIKNFCSSIVINIKIQECGIYALYNIQNNKIYVGSSINMYKRVRRHFSDLKKEKHYNKHLTRAYKKYKDTIIPVVLEIVDNKQNLIEREQYWIDYFESYKTKNGYNICIIADRLTGIFRTDEEKKYLSIINTGRKHTEESKQKMSESRKGIQYSEETINKMKESHIGKNLSEESKEKLRNINIITVYQYDLDGAFVQKWKSAAEAARVNGFDSSSILKCCKNKLFKHKGYIWKFEYFDKLVLKSKKIIQKDLNDNIIKIWDSIKDIRETLSYNAGGICQCCIGNWEKYQNYKWEYKYC
jgi:group I intron endonuclease